jgi:membrane protease YdiL (CAAX protease family)
MAIVGMTFSPIGEELFFRGIVHSSFAKSFGDKKASIIDSSAFAIIHISHFGLVFINNQWDLLIIPTVIWVLSMFFISISFYKCREKSGSLFGAMICHSAFNLGMIYCIFYLLN